MELYTQRLKLLEITLADLDNIHHLHSRPETVEFNTLGIPANIKTTKRLLHEWLTQQNAEPRNSYIFCMFLLDSDQFVGLCALVLGKENYNIAEVWYKILPVYWRQGFTTEALHKILTFGFTNLHLHRIEAGCAVDNIASIKVLEKVGMIREGRKRKVLPIRGTWSDNYIYAILKTDFFNKNK